MVSYELLKKIFWVLLCLPVLIVAIKGFSDLRGYTKKLRENERKKLELIRQQEEEQRLEEERRRCFELQYMSTRQEKR